MAWGSKPKAASSMLRSPTTGTSRASATSTATAIATSYGAMTPRSLRKRTAVEPSSRETPLAQQRPVGFLPGVDAALDVRGGSEARVLRRLHRHGRALPEGAVEDDALASGAGEFVQHAARTDIGRKIRVGRV